MVARSAPDPVPPILVRPEEAARRLSISVAYLYLLKDRGQIIFRKLGGATVIRVAELEALAANLPAGELDMGPIDSLLPHEQQQLAGERASEPRRRGRPRRSSPAAPEPDPAADMTKSIGPLLPLDQQQLALQQASEPSQSDEDRLPPPELEPRGWERE